MKKLFGLKAKDKRNRDRYREEVLDLDREYDEDEYYEDDEEYPEEDYPERDYANDVRDDQEDDYPEDADDRYEDRYEDDYPERDYADDVRDDQEDDYPEEDEIDDRYEDDYPEEDYSDDEYGEYYSDEDDYPGDDYPEDEDEDAYYPGDARYEGRRGRGDRKDRGESVPSKIIGFIANTSATERIAAIFALLILAGAIATGSFYVKAMGNRQQLDSFTEVGADMAEVTVIGQGGLIAVADAERAKAMAAELVSEDAMLEEEEEEEVPDDAENVTIKMTLTSIKSDMKVKFINSQTGKLVANLPLEIDVETPDGSKVTYNDHDQDGIIYKKDITAGVYKITPKELPAGYENYKLEIKTQSLTVKDQVEMKAVDVSNEVKKESQVNAAKEDTAVKAEVESQLKDTVEWVESTKTAVGESTDGTYTYEEVKKDSIPDPGSSTMVGVRPWMFMMLSSTTDVSIEDNDTPKSSEPGQDASTGGSSSESSSGNSSESGNNGDNNGGGSGSGDSGSGSGDTPKPEKEKLSINVSNTTMTVDDTQTVSATGTSKKITFSSDDSSVVSVSGDTLTAKKAGSATITASADDCESAAVTITVKEKEKVNSKFSVDGNTITVKAGATASIGASATSKITYTSKDTAIATVSADGVVTGVKEGSTSISLKADGYDDAVVNVTVSKADKKDMKGVSANPSMKVGDSTKITVTEPSKVSFKSDNEKIATVASDGTVKAIAEGTANITLSADGYNDAKVVVTVAKADAKTMTITPASVNVKVSDTVALKVEGPKKVTFKSENDKVATVSSDGKVKGVSVGTTTIKVTADGYAEVVVNVTVVAKEGNKVPMKISKITLVEGQSVKVSSSEKNLAIKLESSKTDVATVSDTTITGKAAGEATIKVTATGYAENTIAVTVVAKSKTLKDKDGNVLWVKKEDGSYREATLEDYYNKNIKFYLRKAATNYKYTGWQTIEGKTYFFDKNGNYVTGEQVIQGAKYSFGSDGALANNAGGRGIDVSKWNGNIDWAAVKNSGINFVIIRCGYRGSSEGALIEDPTFRRNIQGAQNAGIRVGVYFFTQAVNEVEAVEEASMVINLIKGYNISYPVYLDVEASHGRGDGISAAQRTANIKAFCGTIQNAGYKAGVYANKTWFTSYINTSQITNYKIWLAQYAEAVTYSGSRYDMWQYTSKAKVTGINGYVDMNICY
ncbi:GH25 family lysozyme [Butyrivibrio sp. VCB2006]|uniref:GH25 family lysozyme n=1 Tax=Butyrivibrio sp. VCB2006 TaxID=1280679 RepID=UPI0003FB2F52|nr:GH25 family lysozyme [Butyrivibrio sp. VCB2006]